MSGTKPARVLVLWLSDSGPTDDSALHAVKERMCKLPVRLMRLRCREDCLAPNAGNAADLLHGIGSVFLPVLPGTLIHAMETGDFRDAAVRLLCTAMQRGIPVSCADPWPDRSRLPSPVVQRLKREDALLAQYGIRRDQAAASNGIGPSPKRVISEETLRHHTGPLELGPNDLLTPLARDYAKAHGIQITRGGQDYETGHCGRTSGRHPQG